MKSLMEEASSVAKAVDQAWKRAGKPTSFSVKVLEEAEKSFFGFFSKNAKIALLFDEQTITSKPRHSDSFAKTATTDRRDTRVNNAEKRDSSRDASTTSPRYAQETRNQDRSSDRSDRRDSSRKDTRDAGHDKQRDQRTPRDQNREHRDQDSSPSVRALNTEKTVREPREAREQRTPRDQDTRRETSREKAVREPREHPSTSLRSAQDVRDQDSRNSRRDAGHERPERQERHQRPDTRGSENDEHDDQKNLTVWSDEMVAQARTWLEKTIDLLNIEPAPFETEVNRYYLKIKFNKAVLDDLEQERLLFSSFAHLVMQSLRQTSKHSLKGLKVVLNRP